MKSLVIAAALLLVTATAFAENVARVGFKAFSSATAVTCNVYGMKNTLSGGFQGFAPYSVYSRSLSLGTKGYANYSTTGKGAVKFTCVNTGTNTTAPVKVQFGGFLNGLEQVFLVTDSDTLITQ